MWGYLTDFHKRHPLVLQAIGAAISISAIISINYFGYLSSLPDSFILLVSPDFLLSYSLQFSMHFAAAYLFGWMAGDTYISTTNLLYRFAETRDMNSQARATIGIIALQSLGNLAQPVMRWSFGLLFFCVTFSGIGIFPQILTMLSLAVGLYLLVLMQYFKGDSEAARDYTADLSLLGFFSKIVGNALKAFYLPSAVFIVIFFSKELGEQRALKVLSSNPVQFSKSGVIAIPFATSRLGLIVNIRQDREDGHSVFAIIDNSGDEIIRSN